ncbi:sporulation protein YqfD [Ruminococcus sp.]|uniref:sporulation protein YqfD n=1 Tax=Ruminococcus sp. TaxID=41978 RepID=UPI001B2903B7|nr:sporulation protein YqfD [Ruminococcus sp.]MBO5559759.1 sporulation protein YqfD [Ruminococcus sp.]
MTLGSIEYVITGDSFAKLFRMLTREGLVYSDMKQLSGEIRICVSLEYCLRFERCCKAAGYQPKRAGVRGILRFYKKLTEHPGIILGTILSALLIGYYSNVILRIDIDTADTALRDRITDVLKEDGFTAGAYIPELDLVLEERSLKQKIDEAAWIGISRTGAGISVDVIEAVEAEKGFNVGMPCHLVACEDGVIEEVELLDGQLMKCIGSGVTKGDIVVSGKIVSENSEWSADGEHVTRKTRYVRSIGKVRGSFTRTVEFEQPFDTEVKALTGTEKKMHFINIFSAQIPMFAKVPDGWYETEYEKQDFPEIGGFRLPFGHTEICLREFDMRSQLLDEEEAFALAEKSAYRYEQNFLKNYELKNKNCRKEVNKDSVRLTVTYELYGEICKESDFFIPAYILPTDENSQEKNVQDSENN